ncbi:hypothetical protein GQ457_14G016490 [Hibiscus cannabinus]
MTAEEKKPYIDMSEEQKQTEAECISKYEVEEVVKKEEVKEKVKIGTVVKELGFSPLFGTIHRSIHCDLCCKLVEKFDVESSMMEFSGHKIPVMVEDVELVLGSDDECSEGKEGGRTNGSNDVIMEMLENVISELGEIKESLGALVQKENKIEENLETLNEESKKKALRVIDAKFGIGLEEGETKMEKTNVELSNQKDELTIIDEALIEDATLLKEDNVVVGEKKKDICYLATTICIGLQIILVKCWGWDQMFVLYDLVSHDWNTVRRHISDAVKAHLVHLHAHPFINRVNIRR